MVIIVNIRMKEFKEKPLIGLEHLGDLKYSLHSINNREKLSNAKKSDNWKSHVSNLNNSKRLFSVDDIIEMKELYRNDISVGFGTLAKMYRVDKVTIHNIMHNKIYKDIGGSVTIRQSIITCNYCGKQSNESNYVRWHGDNCKNKKK